MKKLSIIYWSGTGNTESMANAIADGAKSEQTQVKILNVKDASVEDIIDSDVIALGCPSMGAEVLEETEMEPFVESIEMHVKGKKTALFGSYGWGDGEWMRNWIQRMEDNGAILIEDEGLIVNNEPQEDDIKICRDLGELLSKA